MDGYQTENNVVRIGDETFNIRSLSNRQQFWDPGGSAEKGGVSPASWPMFGVMWPAALVLAERMARIPIAGRSILEVGCGLGLSSLVLARRGAVVTASDYHPLADDFLAHNAAQNNLSRIPFWTGGWSDPSQMLGRFDLMIASDVLYERDHPDLLAAFFAAHANATCEIQISDPGRGHGNHLTRQLQAQGYGPSQERCAFSAGEVAPFRGRVTTYIRNEKR